MKGDCHSLSSSVGYRSVRGLGVRLPFAYSATTLASFSRNIQCTGCKVLRGDRRWSVSNTFGFIFQKVQWCHPPNLCLY